MTEPWQPKPPLPDHSDIGLDPPNRVIADGDPFAGVALWEFGEVSNGVSGYYQRYFIVRRDEWPTVWTELQGLDVEARLAQVVAGLNAAEERR